MPERFQAPAEIKTMNSTAGKKVGETQEGMGFIPSSLPPSSLLYIIINWESLSEMKWQIQLNFTSGK